MRLRYWLVVCLFVAATGFLAVGLGLHHTGPAPYDWLFHGAEHFNYGIMSPDADPNQTWIIWGGFFKILDFPLWSAAAWTLIVLGCLCVITGGAFLRLIWNPQPSQT